MRLAARDASFRSLLIRYESVQRGGADAARPLVTRGLWYRDDATVAMFAFTGRLDEQPSWEHTAWNHTRALSTKGRGSWSDTYLLDPTRQRAAAIHTISRSSGLGLLGRLDMPGNAGLFYVNTKWSDYLPRFSDVRIIGREDVCGIDCLVVLADMERSGDDGRYSHPWMLRIDDGRTLLVLKSEAFLPASARSASENERLERDGNVLHLGETTWYRGLYTEVEDCVEIERGLWVVTRMRGGLAADASCYQELLLDASSIILDRPPPEGLLVPACPEGTTVNDLIEGLQYSAGHADDEEYESNHVFHAQLAELQAEVASRWKEMTVLGEPFSEARAPAVAAYSLAWMNGSTPRLSALLAASHDCGAKATSGASQDCIASALRAASCELAPIAKSEIASTREPRWFLLAYDGGYRLVRRLDESRAVLFDPLRSIHQVSWSSVENDGGSTAYRLVTSDRRAANLRTLGILVTVALFGLAWRLGRLRRAAAVPAGGRA